MVRFDTSQWKTQNMFLKKLVLFEAFWSLFISLTAILAFGLIGICRFNILSYAAFSQRET